MRGYLETRARLEAVLLRERRSQMLIDYDLEGPSAAPGFRLKASRNIVI
jgi:hypothetical protein